MTPERRSANVLVGAVTVHDGFVLLLQRSTRESFLPNVWGIPAGHVLPGEDPRDACKRELLEETSLVGHIGELLGYSTFTSRRGGMRLDNLQLNFLARVDCFEVKLNPADHSDYRWILLDDIANDLLDPFTKEIVDSARQHYKEQSVRLR
jgi:8-oxo-dGTP pyrophosphatase MutT (NUDIX family)